jgi:protein gp37
MSESSKIEWCDSTFNAWEGCTKISPGCKFCYAETRNIRFNGTRKNWGVGAPRRRTSASNWQKPRRWDRLAGDGRFVYDPACGERKFVKKIEPGMESVRPRVFCLSLGDWLDDEVPLEWFQDLMVLIRETPNLDWLLLTKRPQIFTKRLRHSYLKRQDSPQHWWEYNWVHHIETPQNIWLGVSIENQEAADFRLPIFRSIPSVKKFISAEPLLGELDVWDHLFINEVDWIICGGESGPGARPFHLEWGLSILDQCEESETAFFMKQVGDDPYLGNKPFPNAGKKGNQMDLWPEDLRVRQFPA